MWSETTNRIVAIVNDDVITHSDVTAHIAQMVEEQRIDHPTQADANDVYLMTLRFLIEQQLIFQEAKRLGLTVSNGEIVERLDALRTRFDSEQAFRKWLEESGLTEGQLKEQLREQLLVQRAIDAKVRSTITVTPQEIAQALQQHPELANSEERFRVLHLLVRVNDQRSEEEARARIDAAYQQLSSGADFSELAKRYSEDPHAAEGGAMGWVTRGELLSELDATLAELKPGESSRPIQTRLGFHLLKVEEREAAPARSTLEAQELVSERLRQRQFQEAFNRWLAELKRRAYIDIPES